MAPSPGSCFLSLCATLSSALSALWLPPLPACSLVPAPIGRQARRDLTALLNLAWSAQQPPPPATSACVGLWQRNLPCTRLRRRRGRLFEAQRRQWRQPSLQLWAGWPTRGVRYGEAFHPGPEPGRARSASPGRGRPHANNPRVFCPVMGCPCSDASSARGWTNHASMQAHLNDHCAGSLAGEVPAAYLAQHSLSPCQVCGLLVSRRFNGVHPRCRPEARAAPPAPRPEQAQAQAAGPDLGEVFHARIPVQRHVPKAARSVWAQCLARALANVTACNSLQAWRDLLMLPKAVLRPPRRGGAKRRDAAAQHTTRRCRRWLEGEREELWEAHAARPPRQAGEDDDVSARQAKHPSSQPALPGLVPLGPPPQSQVPDITTDEVLTAARSFRRGSAAGPSGLRGDHLREALGTPHCDEVAAHLADVVRILAAGTAPPELAPHLAGAALFAIPKGADDVRPIAVGGLSANACAKPTKRNPGPSCGPCKSVSASLSAARLLFTLFATGLTGMPGTSPRSSSRLTSVTPLIPLIGGLSSGKCGCTCRASRLGPSGPMAATAAFCSGTRASPLKLACSRGTLWALCSLHLPCTQLCKLPVPGLLPQASHWPSLTMSASQAITAMLLPALPGWQPPPDRLTWSSTQASVSSSCVVAPTTALTLASSPLACKLTVAELLLSLEPPSARLLIAKPSAWPSVWKRPSLC